MSQYFIPVNLDKQAIIQPGDYESGDKLMEQSTLKDKLLAHVVYLLSSDWSGDRLVWAGDYGPARQFVDEFHPTSDCNLHRYATLAFQSHKEKPPQSTDKHIIVNDDRHEYVDLWECPPRPNGRFTIHPLPLLTSSGVLFENYLMSYMCHSKREQTFIGLWAGDHLRVVEQPPKKYVEIRPDFVE